MPEEEIQEIFRSHGIDVQWLHIYESEQPEQWQKWRFEYIEDPQKEAIEDRVILDTVDLSPAELSPILRVYFERAAKRLKEKIDASSVPE